MKTVGLILKETRLARHYTLAQVEQATKIRLKFLQAIEADDYSQLPSLAYAKGFVKNYAQFLGLPTNNILAFFRRQTTEIPKNNLLPKPLAGELAPSPLRLTPGRFLAGLLIGLVSLFLLYFLGQYHRLNQPPMLTLESPQDKLITNERRIEIIGKTEPDATVIINGISVLVRSDGKFFEQIALTSGVNKITVSATSRYGKTTTLIREIGAQQPE